MKKNIKKEQIKTVIILAIIIVLLLWGINLFTLEKDPNRGTYGDMFGAVNALFSGLAFAGIIITIYYQNYQIEQQQIDLYKQNESIRIQRFENTFFQMINLYNNIVENFDKTFDHVSYNGKNIFTAYLLKLKEFVEKDLEETNYRNSTQFIAYTAEDILTVKDLTSNEIINLYNYVYLQNVNTLAHYFRSAYHIVKLIHNTNDIDKSFYISIFRSQLSNSEQVILVYNCLHENGREKFKPLAEKYSLFQNIDRSTILNENIVNNFDITAFD